ncbi:MAG: sugar phosphate isomerase/epimerase family protein [Planctomycetota bacterium]|jgi:sugar phosphate isomerase/epimerase
MIKRRAFLKRSVVLAGAPGLLGRPRPAATPSRKDKPVFEISLAQWSLHRALLAGELETLDFPAFAQERFEIGAVEYVNTFFKERARDRTYLDELKARAADAGVSAVLIMVDGEGPLGHPDNDERARAIERHHPWVEAARHLGCHSIRVNAQSEGTPDEQRDRVADGLRRLTEFAAPYEINVIVENHGGLSSNGKWLAGVIRQVDHPRCGTLPDFGNFLIEAGRWYDRYQGVKELMPFAKAVSAKSHDFDDAGNEIHTDYRRMMRIVLDAGYCGHVGIEYEGENLSEVEGIRATKTLLERVRAEVAPG